jgi:hypothetical protein
MLSSWVLRFAVHVGSGALLYASLALAGFDFLLLAGPDAGESSELGFHALDFLASRVDALELNASLRDPGFRRDREPVNRSDRHQLDSRREEFRKRLKQRRQEQRQNQQQQNTNGRTGSNPGGNVNRPPAPPPPARAQQGGFLERSNQPKGSPPHLRSGHEQSMPTEQQDRYKIPPEQRPPMSKEEQLRSKQARYRPQPRVPQTAAPGHRVLEIFGDNWRATGGLPFERDFEFPGGYFVDQAIQSDGAGRWSIYKGHVFGSTDTWDLAFGCVAT